MRGPTVSGIALVAAILLAAAAARANLVVTSDGVAVHDTKANIYWLRDLTTFDHLSYDDQQAAIAAFGDGNWRMAGLADIESLDVNPDGDIHDGFLPTAQSSVKGVNIDIYFGRVDFDFGGGSHMIAHMSWNTDDDVVYSELMYLGNGGSDDGPGQDGQGGFAAWVVHEGDYVPPCPWDCGDGDGDVGIQDFLALLAQWGTDGSCDFDGDGAVDIDDFLALLANWGECS